MINHLLKKEFSPFENKILVRLILLMIFLLMSLSENINSAPLNGNYTIDAAGSGRNNFLTITDAVAALYTEGIDGEVIFNITGTFNEQIILNGPITGSSKFNPITFQANSSSGIIEYTASSHSGNFIVKINEAQYINFRNLEFRFDYQPGTEGNVVYSDNPQGNITFEENTFLGISGAPSGSQNSALINIVADDISENIDEFSFIDNIFINGTYGLFLNSHSSNPSYGLLISENEFQTDYQPVNLNYFDAPEILSNTIPNYSDEFAIYLGNCSEDFIISKNEIRSNSTFSSGISLDNCVSSSSRGKIVNNFIQAHEIGILIDNSENIDLFFNSINIEHISSTSSLESKALEITSTCQNIESFNNIYANQRNGLAFDGASQSFNGNYNCFFSNSSLFAKIDNLPCHTLGELQTRSNGDQDLQSIKSGPNFTSISDLHTTEPVLHRAGTQIATVTTDIDNDLRLSATPCIGADEYYLPLSGIFTIGNSADYSTIADAVYDLYESGIDGAVTFKIKDGQFNEQINLDGAITGSSSTNTVTFESNSGFHGNVNITYSANSSASNYVLRINEAKHLKFKNLTFTASGTTYARIVSLENARGNIEFTGNVFNGYSESTTIEQDLIQMNGSGYIEDLYFSNNTLSNGYFGLYLNSTTIHSDNVQIYNNTFSTKHSALYLYRLRYSQILMNTIIHSSSSSPAIYLSNSASFNIEKNTISCNHPVYGTAIEISSSSGSSNNRSKIINNFLQSSIGGIINNHSSYVDIYYNTINIENALKTDNNNTYGIVNQTSANNGKIKNNIINNYRAGYSIYNLSTAISEIDYNNLYTTGPILVKSGSDDYETLTDWQAAPEGFDQNSYSSAVTFVSETDLHIQNASELLLGTVLPEVSDDIDGDARNDPPFIGADEPILDISELTLKIFLEGPYNSVSQKMSKALTIPTTSPYSEHYKTVISVHPGAIDWVLVKLLDELYNTVVAQSAFLLDDGSIISANGSLALKFLVDNTSDYYVVVEHRNHLPVMSSSLISFKQN
jgi:hypothetical protein